MKTVNPSTQLRINGESFDVAQDASKDAEPVEARRRTIKFITLGCKVNQYDTQNIRERFLATGFKELTDGRIADIYVINTCTVTHKADRESLYYINKSFHENRRAKIIVTGCLTELDSGKILATRRSALIIKNQDKDRILEYLKVTSNKEIKSGISYFKGHTRAFLKIQDGCNNFCSYCKVPLVRGKSRSRPLNEIILEAQRLVKNDFKEIVLCGICLGAYGKDLNSGVRLSDAIEQLEEIDGLLRLRLSSIEAADISEELIETIAVSRKACRHLHIPLQSGDNEILRKMQRNYRYLDYLNIIKKIKKLIPQIAITTDIMVGFPGESEENFKNTLKLVKKISPLRVHIFPFSPRNSTPAYKFLQEKVSPLVIKNRSALLKNIADDCSYHYRKQFLNKNMLVLIEERSKENPIFWEGYTDNYIRVLLESDRVLKNQLVKVKLKKILAEEAVDI